MTMGEKILHMRKARGWSQEELAEQIGVSRQAVSRWESDSAKPDADKIISICELFGVSADYILRDIPGGYGTTVEMPELKNRYKQWPAWCSVAFGAITLFILRILASVNRIWIPPVIEQGPNGYTVTKAGHYAGMRYYLFKHDLKWLAWMAIIALVFGLCWLFLGRYREWKKKQHPSSESS